MSKSQKDNIKDVGGFVGGGLKNGRRKAENIQNRTLITLDIDYANNNTLSNIKEKFKFAYAIYSTHSHTEKKQRYRIIIPLIRPVLPDEYQAISRMIASDVDIEIFDDTTYQPHRLMYWPSTSSDGEYIFKYNDDKFLDPGVILSRYFDWKDISYWPQSSRETAHIDTQLKKQEDPESKKGVVGAFCKVYGISGAIDKFLSDIYECCVNETRYTYLEGSTSGGVVIYEDKFSYSHHATDPTSGILCNAFDLVRIHKFGDLDESTRIDTPNNRMPSFLNMCEFASRDKEVIKMLGKERLSEALEDFEDAEVDDELDWLSKMTVNSKGLYDKTTDNILTILENDPNLKGKLLKSEFSNRAIIKGKLPWRQKNIEDDWSDSDDAGIRHYIEKFYGISSANKVSDALAISFEKNTFHPIKDYFEALNWDKVERLDNIFIDYLGAEDSDYTKAIARKTFVAAVTRIYVPGIKFDTMTVLSGRQGIGKSTLIKKLGQNWFSDTLDSVSGKEAYEQLQGVWIVEIGELTATKKADIEQIKHFLSKQEDIFRVAYGRHTSRFKRQCIFIGTTNDSEFLRDATGGRRFWPIDVGVNKIKKSVFSLDQTTIDQIWAEALHYYKKGETIYLNKKQEEWAINQQKSHSEESEKAGIILAYADKEITDNWYKLSIYDRKNYIQGLSDFGESEDKKGTKIRDKISVMEIWVECLNGSPKNLKPIISREISNILMQSGHWVRAKNPLHFGTDYGKMRGFKRV